MNNWDIGYITFSAAGMTVYISYLYLCADMPRWMFNCLLFLFTGMLVSGILAASIKIFQ